MGTDKDIFDGVTLEQYRYQASEGVLYRRTSQPSRGLILERNAELRKDPSALRDLTFGRQALTIPLEDYTDLLDKYPDLRSKDAGIRTKAWQRFIASPESEIYRVRAKV